MIGGEAKRGEAASLPHQTFLSRQINREDRVGGWWAKAKPLRPTTKNDLLHG